jgi:EXLDI family protein
MPNKTIYVSDGDLPLFERAQSLAGGNLSAAITQALREYVRSAEVLRLHQYDSVTVSVGPAGSRRKKRFTAICLARGLASAGKASPMEELVAYRTAGGRLAVYRCTGGPLPELSPPAGAGRRSCGGWSGPVGSIAEAEACDEPGEAVLEVYDTMDEFAQHVPPKFVKLVADADAAREIEDLDI